MHRYEIDLYPENLAIENVPAFCHVDDEPADPSVGFEGGRWATVERVEIGGLTLTRPQIIQMVGVEQLVAIEADLSGRISRNPHGRAVAVE